MRKTQFWNRSAGAVLLVLLAGCNRSPSSTPHAADTTVPDFAGKAPNELLQTIEVSTTSASNVAELLESGTNYELRLKEFREHIETGAAAADAVAEHEAATHGEKRQATLSKLQLLYTATQTDRATFEPRLTTDVEALTAEDPSGEAAIVGEAILLQLTCVSAEGRHEDKMATLVEFAERHPEAEAAVALFSRYGQLLQSEGREGDALDCFRTALRLFPTAPQLRSVRARLASMEAAHRHRLAQERANREKVDAIKRRLMHDDGYFVVYTYETQKTLYRFEYDVLQGSDAAVDHILSIPKNWDWDLTARFPETSEGYDRAQALAKEREKKETVMRIPTFGP